RSTFVFSTRLSFFFFFFSSRRRHTRFSRDWSSDVCSSDLVGPVRPSSTEQDPLAHPSVDRGGVRGPMLLPGDEGYSILHDWIARSEERRVGKECRSRWSPDH